ncbi:hypothetical protein Taro_020136 [Colocasia esculenta]|uniref:Uncharacterized protein n=1 Tax=Colocasia esculenta TaxID=4460 RepID=A0A843UY27_COLES|nr:hypothetical protein [Colocasia esculenta]
MTVARLRSQSPLHHNSENDFEGCITVLMYPSKQCDGVLFDVQVPSSGGVGGDEHEDEDS